MSPAEVDADPLARLAVLLSTRPAELVATVRRAAGRNLNVAMESPTRLRALVVPAHLRSRGPVPASISAGGLAPELAAVVSRVDALDRFDRAVLVLVVVEHLTRAEVAGLVDRSVGTVDQAYDRALAATGAEPFELDAALSALASGGIDPQEIRRAEQELARQRRSRTRRRGLVAAAVALAVGALTVPGLLRQAAVEPAWVRAPGEWVQSLRLASTRGWIVESRTVRADVELTELTVAGPGRDRCQVVVDQRLSAGGVTGDRSVRVGGHPGKITAGPDRSTLSWALAPGAIAAVTCSRTADPVRSVTELADQLVFAAEPVRLAFRLTVLPAHFQVDQIKVRPQQGDTVVELWPDLEARSSPPISMRQSAGGSSGTEPPELDAAGEEVTLTCRLENAISVCASVAGSGARSSRTEQTRTDRRLRLIVNSAVLAPSGADPATWFDARDALPRG